jgi:hypothetical protein
MAVTRKTTGSIVNVGTLSQELNDFSGEGIPLVKYSSPASFPVAGDTNVLYYDALNGGIFRWSGAAYIPVSGGGGGGGGDVSSVSGRIGNVTLTSADVGLNNVNNTTDANKPVSTATQAALDLKLTRVSSIIQIVAPVTVGAANVGSIYELTTNINTTITLGVFIPGDTIQIINRSTSGRLTISASAGSIDGVVTRVLLPGESCVLLWNGTQFFKTGGRSIPFYAFNGVSFPNLASTVFTKVPYSTPPNPATNDPIGSFNSAGLGFALPRAGVYDVRVGLRVTDNVSLRNIACGSLGIAGETVPADAATSTWANTATGALPANRNGINSSRILSGAQGDIIYHVYFNDGPVVAPLTIATLTISEIVQW